MVSLEEVKSLIMGEIAPIKTKLQKLERKDDLDGAIDTILLEEI